MKVTKTYIEGLIIIEPIIYNDKRGSFFESYNEKKFRTATKSNYKFIQDNESESYKGVLRGLHFQHPPYAQAKLVRCISGKVLDVAVDIRSNSKTYGKHLVVELSAENKKQMLIPPGFAHGFLVLSDSAVFCYKVDKKHSPESDSGIRWDDSTLNIQWGVDKNDILVSEKDSKLQPFTNFNSPFQI